MTTAQIAVQVGYGLLTLVNGAMFAVDQLQRHSARPWVGDCWTAVGLLFVGGISAVAPAGPWQFLPVGILLVLGLVSWVSVVRRRRRIRQLDALLDSEPRA